MVQILAGTKHVSNVPAKYVHQTGLECALPNERSVMAFPRPLQSIKHQSVDFSLSTASQFNEPPLHKMW